MYFEDLSNYRYRNHQGAEQVSNIGWLERSHPFKIGTVHPLLCQLFADYYDVLIRHQTRGHHECQFCDITDPVPTLGIESQSFQLGAAELWVPNGDGLLFAAPDLIIHYIHKHSYQPPEEFTSAVMRLPATMGAALS